MMPALDDVDSEAMKELDQEELEDVTKAQGKDAISKLRSALKSVRHPPSPAARCPASELYICRRHVC